MPFEGQVKGGGRGCLYEIRLVFIAKALDGLDQFLQIHVSQPSAIPELGERCRQVEKLVFEARHAGRNSGVDGLFESGERGGHGLLYFCMQAQAHIFHARRDNCFDLRRERCGDLLEAAFQ